jgi:alpha-galactosidase/6-phospho-beta-glucosidase family protein
MPSLKIVLLGAGSYVFGPSTLAQTFLEHALDDVELALVDLDAEAVDLTAAVARRMAAAQGLSRVTVSAHTDRRAALPGADFVICSVAVQMRRRFARDVEIIARDYPGHVLTEFGGVSGISSTLRQIALIEAVCADMRELCARARLLDAANPLPRVCQAASECGIETYGFCSVSLTGYGWLWRLLTGETSVYPYSRPRDTWEAVMGGLNHFCWVTELRERATGRDLLPDVRARLAAGAGSGHPLAEELTRQTGFPITPTDDHIQDFLEPGPHHHTLSSTSHGNTDERAARLRLLADVAAGRAPWEPLLAHAAWEKPLDLIAALARGRAGTLHSLNVSNRDGLIPELPRSVYVEVPASVDGNGVHPRRISLPSAVVPLCQRTAHLSHTLVRAGLEHRLAGVREAVEADPTITDKAAGHRAVTACLAAHADLLPTYT